MNLDTFGGRKFLLCVGCHLISSLLLWFGKLDGSAYTTIILASVGAYIAGNVAASKVQGPKA